MPIATLLREWPAALAVSALLMAVPADGAAQVIASPDAISRGWAAIEAGRYADAVAAANASLQTFPRSHAAIVLKIAALAAGDRTAAAFDAYQSWAAGRRNDDRYLVGMIAEGVLRRLGASASDPAIRVKALQALASAGDRGAADSLSKLSSGLDRDAALAALGDESAARAVVAAVGRSEGSRKADAIDAAARVGGPGAESAIQPLLASPDPAIRAAAAEAVGRMGAAGSGDALLPLLEDEMPEVKRNAAVALARLGRPEGDALIGTLLDSGVPDVVLGIAEGLPDHVSRWQAQVEPLLQTENPIDRLRAARLLKDVLPDAAEAVLTGGLADSNVAVREEASRALDEIGLRGKAPDWPALLTDASPWVRLEAARTLFQQVLE